MFKVVILFAPLKARSPIVVTPLPIVRLVIPLAPQKAPSEIVRTVSGITTLVIERLSLKASVAILVTPLGIFTEPTHEVFPVTTSEAIVKKFELKALSNKPVLQSYFPFVTAFDGTTFKLNKIKVVINVAKILFGITGFKFLLP